MEKRGYFFELDAALALFILVMGAFFIASYYIKEPEVVQAGLLSDDLMDYLSDTKIRNLDNTYAGLGGELWNKREIVNPDNSLLQQAGEFYATGRRDLVYSFIKNTTTQTVPYQYLYEIWLDNKTIYPQNLSQSHNASRNGTGLFVVSRAITYGLLNNTPIIWGPYKVEIYVWER
jgi:hypothetical protein